MMGNDKCINTSRKHIRTCGCQVLLEQRKFGSANPNAQPAPDKCEEFAALQSLASAAKS